MADSVEARVARGAAWLDKNRPGWEGKFDPSRFDIRNAEFCICGFVFGDYLNLWTDLVIAMGTSKARTFMEAHGFISDDDADLDALDAAWPVLIKERFDTGNLSG